MRITGGYTQEQNIFDIEIRFRSECGGAQLLLTPIEVLYPELGSHSGNEIAITAEALFADDLAANNRSSWRLGAKVPGAFLVSSLIAFADELVRVQAGLSEHAELTLNGSAFVRIENALRPGYVVVGGTFTDPFGVLRDLNDPMIGVRTTGEPSKTGCLRIAFVIDQTSLTPAIDSMRALMRQLDPAKE